jgi:hypothetical protein
VYLPEGGAYVGVWGQTWGTSGASWAQLPSINSATVWSGRHYDLSYFTTAMPLHIYGIKWFEEEWNQWTAMMEVSSAYAIVYRRQLIVNSTTPANTYGLTSFNWELSGSQALAVGSLNWIAVGE